MPLPHPHKPFIMAIKYHSLWDPFLYWKILGYVPFSLCSSLFSLFGLCVFQTQGTDKVGQYNHEYSGM